MQCTPCQYLHWYLNFFILKELPPGNESWVDNRGVRVKLNECWVASGLKDRRKSVGLSCPGSQSPGLRAVTIKNGDVIIKVAAGLKLELKELNTDALQKKYK